MVNIFLNKIWNFPKFRFVSLWSRVSTWCVQVPGGVGYPPCVYCTGTWCSRVSDWFVQVWFLVEQGIQLVCSGSVPGGAGYPTGLFRFGSWWSRVSNWFIQVRFLVEQGIDHLVSLSPEKIPPHYAFPNLKHTLIPVEDFTGQVLVQDFTGHTIVESIQKMK